MTKAQMVRATALLLPDALALVRTLLARFDGDVAEVRAALRRIPDHGARLDAAEASFDARMRVVEKKHDDDPGSRP